MWSVIPLCHNVLNASTKITHKLKDELHVFQFQFCRSLTLLFSLLNCTFAFLAVFFKTTTLQVIFIRSISRRCLSARFRADTNDISSVDMPISSNSLRFLLCPASHVPSSPSSPVTTKISSPYYSLGRDVARASVYTPALSFSCYFLVYFSRF